MTNDFLQNGLPRNISQNYGDSRSAPNDLRDREFSGKNGGKAGAAGGRNIAMSTSTVRINIGEMQSFQLLIANPKRVFLMLTALSDNIQIAFGKTINSNDPQFEFTLDNTQSLKFDSENAPTCSVYCGTGDGSLAISIMEGVLL